MLVILGVGEGREDIQVIRPLHCGGRIFMKKQCSLRYRSTGQGLGKSSRRCLSSHVGKEVCVWHFI